VNTARPLRPTVLIYDPAVPREDAIVVELAEEPVFDYLQPRKRVSYYFDTEALRGP
jgi:hypothetical protein